LKSPGGSLRFVKNVLDQVKRDFGNSLESGDVAQMGERYVRNVQVRGSIPLISTTNKDKGMGFEWKEVLMLSEGPRKRTSR
jgi:hypothetical protein